jgi:CTD small phosphatase-like protein 2
LKPDFLKHINKLNKNKKKAIYKNSEILLIISKNINKAFDSMKNYLIINLKYSLIKPFGEAVFQMITSLEKRNLYQFASIFLKTILYGELEINKKKVIQNSLNFKAKFQNLKQNNNNKNELNNNYLGSSFINNVREIPPFLPPINQRYKYTLVLDMDETLVHFFFTHINGMFFVRPYCFEFLNELNNFYEIITFTAATKEYADNILNQLDLNDNIIKFRLYRQHITIMGFNVYKDLNKIGRDLSKIIIIDNLKENFKIQPNNVIFIKTWISDVNDTQFKDLLKILKDIAISNVDDVRPIIQKMNENIIANGSLINPYSSINIQKIIEDINNKKK